MNDSRNHVFTSGDVAATIIGEHSRPGQANKSLFNKQVYDMRRFVGDLLCCICSKPVPLEDRKAEEHCMAAHGERCLPKLSSANEDASLSRCL